MKKQNLLEAAAGVGLIALTLADLIPGDEIAGVPVGAMLILDGMRWL